MSKNVKPSARVQKNSAPLPLKNKNTPSRTKPETTIRPNEHIDIELFDYWVDNLDASTQDSFCGFAADVNSVIEIYIYARFLGYKGPITACELWVNTNYPKPDQRKKLLSEIDEMQEDIRKLRTAIEETVVKRDAGVARIANVQRELRGHIDQLDRFMSNRDRKGLLMSGADRAIRELLLVFKDDPMEIALEEAAMSVWARMQMEE